MRRVRGSRPGLGVRFAVLLLLVSLLSPLSAAALQNTQGMTSRTVGSSNISFSDEWVVEESLADDAGIVLWHQQHVSDAFFLFGEVDYDPSVPGKDFLIEGVSSGLDEILGSETADMQLAAVGTTPTGVEWVLFRTVQDGVPYGLLAGGLFTEQPDQAMVMALVAPIDVFESVAEAALHGIDRNGTGSPLSGFEPAELVSQLGGNAQTSSTEVAAVPTVTEGADVALPDPTEVSSTQPAMASEMVADSTVFYGDVWVYDPEFSDQEIASFEHASMPFVFFFYGEVFDPTVQDENMAMDVLSDVFIADFGGEDAVIADQGTVSSGEGWRLYTLMQGGIPLAMLITSNVDADTSMVTFTLLLAGEGSFDLALEDATTDIDVDGEGSPLGALDAARLNAVISGEGLPAGAETAVPPQATATVPAGMGGLELPPLNAPTSAPTTVPTFDVPTEEPDSTGGLTLPGATATVADEAGQTGAEVEEVQVAGVPIQYGEGWRFDEPNSMPGQSALFNGDPLAQATFAFAVFENQTGLGAEAGLTEFMGGFIEGAGATLESTLGSGTPSANEAWGLYRVEIAGTPFVVLGYADTGTAPSEFRAQILVVTSNGFLETLQDAQASFTVDGAGAFDQLDSQELNSLIGP